MQQVGCMAACIQWVSPGRWAALSSRDRECHPSPGTRTHEMCTGCHIPHELCSIFIVWYEVDQLYGYQITNKQWFRDKKRKESVGHLTLSESTCSCAHIYPFIYENTKPVAIHSMFVVYLFPRMYIHGSLAEYISEIKEISGRNDGRPPAAYGFFIVGSCWKTCKQKSCSCPANIWCLVIVSAR